MYFETRLMQRIFSSQIGSSFRFKYTRLLSHIGSPQRFNATQRFTQVGTQRLFFFFSPFSSSYIFFGFISLLDSIYSNLVLLSKLPTPLMFFSAPLSIVFVVFACTLLAWSLVYSHQLSQWLVCLSVFSLMSFFFLGLTL